MNCALDKAGKRWAGQKIFECGNETATYIFIALSFLYVLSLYGDSGLVGERLQNAGQRTGFAVDTVP